MESAELLAELNKRGHNFIYHACTLTTFCSYCEERAYRSRAHLEEQGRRMSRQFSDQRDKDMGVFDHLFLNIYDQHADVHKGRSVYGLNKFGPVLMVFRVDCLKCIQGNIKSYSREISANNYNASEHEIETLHDFINQTFYFTYSNAFSSEPSRRPGTRGSASTIFFKEESRGIPFEPYLHEVIVDELPGDHKLLGVELTQGVTNALASNGFRVNVSVRNCIPNCGCRPAYLSMKEEQVRRFFYETTEEVSRMHFPRQF